MTRSVAVVLLAGLLWGCQANRSEGPADYQTVALDRRRDTDKAVARTTQANVSLEAGKLEDAEAALKAALVADLFYGPAHNTLGVVYYRQKRFYLAAWEFQYAAKLMEDRPEPRNNLGLVFEAIGKFGQAAEHYREALRLGPDNPQFLGNLARCRIRDNQRDAETRELLEELIAKDTRPAWVEWARMQLLKIPQAGKPRPPTGAATSQPYP